MSETIRRLARQRTGKNWLAIYAVVITFIALSTPIYYAEVSKNHGEIVVFDLTTGSEILAPVVDPVEAHELIEVISEWCAETILNRSAAGLDHENLVHILFDPDRQKQVHDEYAKVAREYATKKMRSHVEIKHVKAQTVGGGEIESIVECQDITNGVDDLGGLTQSVKTITLTLHLAVNPNLEHRKHYPLMCHGFEEVEMSRLVSK